MSLYNILDPVANFVIAPVLQGYAAGTTTISVQGGYGLLFPDPAVVGAYNVTWWNATDYSNPSDDPLKSIVRITAKSVDTFTITVAQEGTTDTAHNLAGRQYKLSLGITAKMTQDIETYLQAQWRLMEVITFAGTSAVQTSAAFRDAATAKQYKILVDVVGSTTSQSIGMRVNESASVNPNDYLTTYFRQEGATFGATGSTSGFYQIYNTGSATGTQRVTGEIIIGAQESIADKVPVVCNLGDIYSTTALLGFRGNAHLDTSLAYVNKIGFLSSANMTGTFKIYQHL